jgi:hypothetical protein
MYYASMRWMGCPDTRLLHAQPLTLRPQSTVNGQRTGNPVALRRELLDHEEAAVAAPLHYHRRAQPAPNLALRAPGSAGSQGQRAKRWSSLTECLSRSFFLSFSQGQRAQRPGLAVASCTGVAVRSVPGMGCVHGWRDVQSLAVACHSTHVGVMQCSHACYTHARVLLVDVDGQVLRLLAARGASSGAVLLVDVVQRLQQGVDKPCERQKGKM